MDIRPAEPTSADEEDHDISNEASLKNSESTTLLREPKSLSAQKITKCYGVTFDVLEVTPCGERWRFDLNLDEGTAQELRRFTCLFKPDKPIEIGLRHISGILKE